jgi:hypothetical protein
MSMPTTLPKIIMSSLPKSLSRSLSQNEELPEEHEELIPTTSPRLDLSGAKGQRTSVLSRIAPWLVVLLKGCVFVLAIYDFVNLVSPVGVSLSRMKHDNWCECGKSISEAISKGCKFDHLAAAWLPPHCRDDELSAEFNKAGPGPDGQWEYWSDKNGSIPVPPDEVGFIATTENDIVWTTTDWHVEHCVYYWIKQFRSKKNGVVLEKKYDSEDHIRHCGKTFLRYMVPRTIGTRFHAVILHREDTAG